MISEHRNLYKIWWAMIKRCTDKNDNSYKNYGGRGISVCKRWLNFDKFKKDVGHKPTASHSLDRIDNDQGYNPKNCKWSTRAEQRRNSRRITWVTINGETLCFLDWCKKMGITRKAVRDRIAKGMSVECAITTPKCYNGQRYDAERVKFGLPALAKINQLAR